MDYSGHNARRSELDMSLEEDCLYAHIESMEAYSTPKCAINPWKEKKEVIWSPTDQEAHHVSFLQHHKQQDLELIYPGLPVYPFKLSTNTKHTNGLYFSIEN